MISRLRLAETGLSGRAVGNGNGGPDVNVSRAKATETLWLWARHVDRLERQDQRHLVEKIFRPLRRAKNRENEESSVRSRRLTRVASFVWQCLSGRRGRTDSRWKRAPCSQPPFSICPATGVLTVVSNKTHSCRFNMLRLSAAEKRAPVYPLYSLHTKAAIKTQHHSDIVLSFIHASHIELRSQSPLSSRPRSLALHCIASTTWCDEASL